MVWWGRSELESNNGPDYDEYLKAPLEESPQRKAWYNTGAAHPATLNTVYTAEYDYDPNEEVNNPQFDPCTREELFESGGFGYVMDDSVYTRPGNESNSTNYTMDVGRGVGVGDYIFRDDRVGDCLVAPDDELTIPHGSEGTLYGRDVTTLLPVARALESSETGENVRVRLLSDNIESTGSQRNPSTSGTEYVECDVHGGNETLRISVPRIEDIRCGDYYNDVRYNGVRAVNAVMVAVMDDTYCHEYQCGFCADLSVCPAGAIDYADGYSDEGEQPIRVYEDMCDGCGNCENMCPQDKIKLVAKR